jgi:carboxyl-terminal processing protease
MRFTKNRIFIISFFCFLISLSLFFSGVLVGRYISDPSIPALLSQNGGMDIENFLEPLDQTWQIVHEQYLEQPVDDQKLMQGAIRGLMNSLGDPYSSYLDPDEYNAQNTSLDGEYTGIGAWIDTSGSLLEIISPMPNSPAEKAGLKSGDEVIKVDNQDVTSFEPTAVLKLILGPDDTSVLITIRRNDSEVLAFEILRAIIPIPSVEADLIEENIGYIRLYTFGVKSYTEFKSELAQLVENGAQNIIFDLRNNSGGYVDSAIDISSLFLNNKIILIEEWGDGTVREYRTKKSALFKEIPLYILVNEGTASASEITAGAFQDYERATLIGKTTFGKGLIQNWIPLAEDNGAVRISIAHWLTPYKQVIHDQGLTPDIEIDFTEEDFTAGFDPQLQAALDLIHDSEKP